MTALKSHKTMRIVSSAPSVTSILLALGAGKELVGVSKWCKDVAAVGRRPEIGDCWNMDIREVMRLRPTHLIGSVPFATKTVEEILKQPVAFLALNPRTIADVYEDVRTLAHLTNRLARGEKLIRKMTRAFEGVAKRTAPLLTRPRVYCEAWPNPRISSPPWVAEMVEIAADLATKALNGQFAAAQFRDRLDNGRKVAIQILEFFDRHGVTLRRGDLRRMNKHRLDLFRSPPDEHGPTANVGRESSPVGRSDFKSVKGREPVFGGFDSRSLPPRHRTAR